MHHEINYSALPEADKETKALNDIKEWLGVKKFNRVEKDVKACQPPLSRRQFQFMCSIAGFEGYPVEVWANKLGVPPIPKEE